MENTEKEEKRRISPTYSDEEQAYLMALCKVNRKTEKHSLAKMVREMVSTCIECLEKGDTKPFRKNILRYTAPSAEDIENAKAELKAKSSKTKALA